MTPGKIKILKLTREEYDIPFLNLFSPLFQGTKYMTLLAPPCHLVKCLLVILSSSPYHYVETGDRELCSSCFLLELWFNNHRCITPGVLDEPSSQLYSLTSCRISVGLVGLAETASVVRYSQGVLHPDEKFLWSSPRVSLQGSKLTWNSGLLHSTQNIIISCSNSSWVLRGRPPPRS